MEASTSPDAFAPSVAAKAPETVDGQGPIARDRKPEELVEGNSERDEGYLRRKERSSEAEAFEEEAGNHIVVVVLEIGTSEIRIGFSGDKTPRHRLPAFLSRLVEAGPQPEDLHSPLSLAKTFVGEDAFTAATRAAEEDGCAVGVVAAHPHHPWAVSRESYDNLFVVIDAALERLLEERPQGTEASAREKDDAVGESRDKATSSLPTAEMPWALLAVVPVICDQRLASCLLRWALETRREIFGAVKLIADARMAAYHHLLLLPEDQRSAEKGLLVVDAGETAIRVVPVGGQALTPGTHALQQTEVAGSLLTSLVLLHQEKRGEGTRGTRRGMTWREATQYKEQCCFVSLNPSVDLQLHRKYRQLQPPFVTAGGLVRQPSTDTFLFPEIFFTPQLLRNANLSPIVNSTSQASLTQVILDAFGKGTVCERALWLSRICLVGGTAKLANFATRLQDELRATWQSSDPSAYTRRKEDVPIRLLVSDDPQLAAFCGASAFGRVAVLDEEAWITREEYEDSAAIPALGRRALRHANLG
uniref:Actin-like family protein, putative n=1 Tax=Neospora caninum (strain Liverpool) TaxID=572307 RepID=A0A0F7UIK5_NEOCL|nr:TPA: actin-like family protein, putative [Neospora caninum Liverpool]